jgi:site-specific DNA-methyltransferase (cytosine-N4-specific)
MQIAYQTAHGTFIHGTAERILADLQRQQIGDGFDLVLTSPPFPLNRKKRYGNLQGQDYVNWLAAFAPRLKKLLKPTGSIVLELGNAWEPGHPIMSTLALKALLAFLEEGQFHLCQQFVWCNPARLPSPAQWVAIERIRVKDAFTHLWWMSPTERPKANNRRILIDYSVAMQNLLARRTYNSGKRPSQHLIGEKSFLTDNGGAIPSNVITCANTQSGCQYLKHCRTSNITPHPARMPIEVVEFFIKFLTEPSDLVLDPFAGSNTTGATAESLNRRWLSIESKKEYITGSLGRFVAPRAERTASVAQRAK